MMDSAAPVIRATIGAPLMVPILGTALALVLSQRTAMLRSLGTVIGGALAVITVGYLFGLLDPRQATPAHGDTGGDTLGRGAGVPGRPCPSEGRRARGRRARATAGVDPEQLRREFDVAGLADVDLRVDLVVGDTRKLPGAHPG